MNSHDINGVEWAKLSELKAGDKVHLDGGFTCVKAGERVIQQDDNGLYFECDEQRHYLDSQADDGEHLVGIYKA